MADAKAQKARLQNAACKGNADEVIALIKELGEGPDVSVDDYETAPLHLAAIGGHTVLVQRLITECNADVNRAEEDGKTALCMACYTGNLEMVTALLGLGAAPDVMPLRGKLMGLEPREIAGKFHHTECADKIEDFLSKGAEAFAALPTAARGTSTLDNQDAALSMC
eukprot:m.53060 g.53060  ORF g.53060 m.53060 type:complete len:167 (-) comp16617_c0_seq1:106-606(-)